MAKKLRIRGGQVSSINALKKSVKRSTAGGTIQRVPKDRSLTARFITEPDRWFEYYEHYDQAAKKGGVCTGDDCQWCKNDVKISKRILTNAVDIDDSRVIALALPPSLANVLLKFYDKYGTLVDRDYELSRDGDGLNTEYSAIPEGKSRFNHDAYDPLDLGDILEAEAGGDDDDDEDDDDEFLPPKKRATASRTRQASRSKPAPEDDEDEEEAPPPRIRTMPRKGLVKPPVKKALPSAAKKGLRR